MIPVTLAPEPKAFDEHVRKRGRAAIDRLTGKKAHGPGRRPTVTYASPEEIPAKRFPEYWTEPRKSDGKSVLDDLMESYGQYCAYLAMRLERATGSPTVDHFLPKSRDWRLVYEWSNYRLSAACVNGAKGTIEVIDPFKVRSGWFELNLYTFFVGRGALAPKSEHARIDRTLTILNLRPCVSQRGDFVTRYRSREIDFPHIETYAPFIASELRRQGELLEGDGLGPALR